MGQVKDNFLDLPARELQFDTGAVAVAPFRHQILHIGLVPQREIRQQVEHVILILGPLQPPLAFAEFGQRHTLHRDEERAHEILVRLTGDAGNIEGFFHDPKPEGHAARGTGIH